MAEILPIRVKRYPINQSHLVSLSGKEFSFNKVYSMTSFVGNGKLVLGNRKFTKIKPSFIVVFNNNV